MSLVIRLAVASTETSPAPSRPAGGPAGGARIEDLAAWLEADDDLPGLVRREPAEVPGALGTALARSPWTSAPAGR